MVGLQEVACGFGAVNRLSFALGFQAGDHAAHGLAATGQAEHGRSHTQGLQLGNVTERGGSPFADGQQPQGQDRQEPGQVRAGGLDIFIIVDSSVSSLASPVVSSVGRR